ncbi:MAG: phage tail protein [Persicimonas sp.]
MTSLLPGGIADDRFRELDEVAEERFAALPLSTLLVYLLDHVESSALPALAWQFGALGDTWSAAESDTERRELLRQAIARRRRRGTPWAIKDALAALGHPALELQEGTKIRRDGSIQRDGFHDRSGHWAKIAVRFDLPDAEVSDALMRAVKEQKRKSVHIDALFFEHEGETFLRVTDDYVVGFIPVVAGGELVVADGSPVTVEAVPRPWSANI